MKKLRRTSVQLAPDVVEHLDKEARSRGVGVSRNQVVRDAVHAYLNQASLDRLFQEVKDWQAAYLPKRTSAGAIEKLKEELAEAEFEFNEGNHERLSLEMADLFFMWAQVIDLENIDIEYAIAAKLIENRRRKWADPDENGVISHVKED